MVRPKKHLGQHFLHDRNIADKIVRCLSDDHPNICELGPGTGVLTSFLLKRKELRSLTLVEIDPESTEFLQAHFNDPRLTILQADFLRMDLSQIPAPFALIGNFPYNISSQIFFRVIESRDRIPEVVCMIQKEVAERIVAEPGSKTYGILSVLLQAWYTIDYEFTVSEQVFLPPPKVKSAVIRMTRNQVDTLACDEKAFTRIVKTAFNQRRKTLRNALKPLLTETTKTFPYHDKRAEQLSVQDFIELTAALQDT